jgi:hypothetical protein
VRIELSPGDWAGVLHALDERVHGLRELADPRHPEAELYDQDDLIEQAEDLARVHDSLREQIAEAGRELPELTPVTDTDDGESAACQHVWTASDVLAMRDQDAVYNANPEVGSVCGAELEVVERVWDYRPTSWHKGVLRIGDGQLGDGEFVELTCDNGHVWAMPEEVEYR